MSSIGMSVSNIKDCVSLEQRHMNIGNPSRSLALAETGRREFLPVNDKAWEEGVSFDSLAFGSPS
jgi:hypothetical protein